MVKDLSVFNALTGQKQNKATEEATIDFNKVIRIIKKRFIPMLLCLLLCPFLFYTAGKLLIPKQYTSTAMLYVTTKSVSGTSYENYSNLTYALDASATFTEMLDTNNFFDSVSRVIEKETGKHLFSKDIADMVTYIIDEETAVIDVSIENTNPETTYSVANAILEVAPNIIDNLNSSIELKIVNKPQFPQAPSSPNYKNFFFLGFLIGAFLCGVYTVYLYLTDKILRKEDNIDETYDFPVIAYVPDYKADEVSAFRFW